MNDFNPLHYPLSLSEPRYLSGESAWSGHMPFAWALLEMARPRTIVELGTYYGDSYCALCQGVADLKLDARCTAVDTWQGDEHSGAYAEAVYRQLKTYHDPLYGQFSTLIRATFDEALATVADGTVDLLHIDGLHTYEAVRHDFETWQPKLSARGIVLFHDTVARHADFGVWRLWGELESRYPSFAFAHESGLGMLACGNAPPPEVLSFIESARREAKRVQDYFAVLGGRVSLGTALIRMGRPLEVARAEINAWRTRTGKPSPPPRGPDEPYIALAGYVLSDVREVLKYA